MATADQELGQAVPYVSFGTFKNFISGLKVGIPARIDKSVMPGLSGGAQSHVLGALRFFGLIGPKGEPLGELNQLVEACNTPQWPEVLSAMIKSSYGELLEGIDLNTATPQQLDELFGEPKAGKLIGSTVDKAVRFFLAAVKEAKIGHSKRLVQRRPRTTRRTRQRSSPAAQSPINHDADHHASGSDFMTVPIYFVGKSEGKIVVPKSITPADCAMIAISVKMVEGFAAAHNSGSPG